jgi:ABC-type multidrug transport system fused ATPase/permease subunit
MDNFLDLCYNSCINNMNDNKIIPISNAKYIQLLWQFSKGERVGLFFGYFYEVITSVLSVYLIYLQGNLVNYFVKNGVNDSFNNYLKEIGYILFITLLFLLFKKQAGSAIIKAKQSIEVNTRIVGIGKVLDFPLQWHHKRSSGKTIQQLNSGSTAVNKSYQMAVANILQNVFEIVSVLWILLGINKSFFLIFLIYTVLIYFNIRYWGNRINTVQREKLSTLEHNNALLFDVNNNILTAKANYLAGPLKELMSAEEDNTLKLKHKEIDLYNNKSIFSSILDSALDMIFYVLIWFSFTSGNLDIGLISVLVRYNNTVRNSILKLIGVSETVRDFKINIERMMPIFDTPPYNFFGTKNLGIIEDIELKDLSFTYPESTNQNLNNINLKIIKGQKIGLVGHSGSGKSTVSKLLSGLYKINEGQLLVNNEDFYSFTEKDLKSKIQLVSQDTELFNLSLKDNITLFKNLDTASFEKIIIDCELKEVVDSLPKKELTLLGEKGFKLSGGQKQRVGIARAFASNAEVIVFDESTSALDTKTEMLIQTAIENKIKNATLIFIAHRLSTLRNVDRIIVFENGKIIEEGKFEELINTKGSKFKELWDVQNTSSSQQNEKDV